MRVLNLGCGTGTLTILAKQTAPKADVTGLDGDPQVLQIGHNKAAYAAAQIQWDTGLAFDLSYPDNAFVWYRSFIQAPLNSGSFTWFAKLVVAGEILVGIALILGLFTGIAAFLGGFMNWNFMMAGTASVSPVFFTLQS